MFRAEAGNGAAHGATGPRIGLFGRLGSGNIGNDASLQAVLEHLRKAEPGAVLDCMCSGPHEVTSRYDLPSTQMHWHHMPLHTRSRLVYAALTSAQIGVGALVDAWRTASWVRRHDVVIVPGMGILESNLAQRPWETPYSLFLLSAFGRLFGTKVVLLSVGATVIPQWLTGRLLVAAGRLAYYRSFRDEQSLEAARSMGIVDARDQVYPDLVFALDTPPAPPRSTRTVGVGVMAYFGSTADRRRAQEINDEYVETMKRFVRWLLETDHEVRLLIGDGGDDPVARAILAEVRSTWRRPGVPPVVYDPISSVDELMDQLAPVDLVVATRFHNVLVALKCAKPTLAIGYGEKHDALMAQLGVGEYVERIRELDLDQLKERFTSLETNKEQVARTLSETNRVLRAQLDHQFADLTAALSTTRAPRARSPVS